MVAADDLNTADMMTLRYSLKRSLIAVLTAALTFGDLRQVAAQGPPPADAEDANFLMIAAQVDFMKSVVDRCETIAPGHRERFEPAYLKAKANFLEPAGVDDDLVEQARRMPELDVAEMVAKFDRSSEDQRRQSCDQTLVQLGEMADWNKAGHAVDPYGFVALDIIGLNYTDLIVELFSVQRRGGGKINVSSPRFGGGKATCCLSWRSGTKLPLPIDVEWMRYVNDKERWCKKTVMLTGPVPANPRAIGVHFMPDGDIQVELIEAHPTLRLKLKRFNGDHRNETANVIHDEKTGSCKDGV